MVTPSNAWLCAVVCFDAKINFDDNAEFRQKDVFAMDNTAESDPMETEAAKFDLKYIGLDGNIACFGEFVVLFFVCLWGKKKQKTGRLSTLNI